eukprot:CAMPEP_0176033104 /NCGR_PEP_ID=MMETSP0120_2-20121206/16347_1 /TAXON_ID=160619 /ORGANISM="Kryptoperidinium foliaceum, Strain CCMP 1326" /LENGTH=334 /DNA_ID=CAMNT_0017366427 /DNA_START=167 /DNA_END=1172 /DNA_ORIENTATION=+
MKHAEKESNEEQPEDSRPSNEKLLCTAFISFMTFALVQTVVALIAKSEALLGDSAAMMVDALTYLFNWYAERQKRVYSAASENGRVGEVEALRLRKYYLQLELLPPLLSVSTLIVVIGFVLAKAIHVLILDASRDVSLQSKPNVNLMLLFSIFNLFLDFLNVFCFARAHHAFGYETNTVDHHDGQSLPERLQLKSMQGLLNDDETGAGIQMEMKGTAAPMSELRKMEDHDEEHESSNLNMCSAYTHVFADTLRSLAVILASILADFVPVITAEEADASAAVVVSVLILASLLPLVKGMIHTLRELRQVNDLLIDGLIESMEYGGDDFDFDSGDF